MKRTCIAWLLCAALVLSLCACADTAQPEAPAAESSVGEPVESQAPVPEPASGEDEPEGLFVPGTYTATATGHNEDFTVTVTFSADAIEAIEIGDNDETGYLGDRSMGLVRDEILASQTVNVDVVTGATVSSGALLAAVRDTVVQAGGDPSSMPAHQRYSGGWQDTATQVVVVGSGSAGLSAAVEANEQGLDVILVEQLGILGGSSVRAGYLMGGSSKLQQEEGIDYSTEDFVSYLADNSQSGTGGGNRSEVDQGLFQQDTAIRIAQMAGENIDWLQDMGVPFTVSGNIFRGNGTRLGPYLVETFTQVLDNRGIDYRLDTRADEILMEDGKAVGVRVEAPDGSFYTISADAVVLATGGYNANQELIAQYNPKYSGYATDVSKGADGSGMLMGQQAGGVLNYMDQANYHSFALLWRGASRSMSSIITNGAIAVNAEGQRFVNEDSYYDESCCDAILSQTGGVCYVIMDQSIADRVLIPGDTHLANHITMYEAADTPEELAQKLGIDADALLETIENYRSYVAEGEDPQLGRGADSMLATFEEGPYYGAKAMPELHTDHGGLIVDIDTRVLDEGGQPISGLYAAGEVAATHVLGSTTHTVCVAQGRIAARTILQDLDQ